MFSYFEKPFPSLEPANPPDRIAALARRIGSKRVSVICGPPGSGKTSLIVWALAKLRDGVLREADNVEIRWLASTNRAFDDAKPLSAWLDRIGCAQGEAAPSCGRRRMRLVVIDELDPRGSSEFRAFLEKEGREAAVPAEEVRFVISCVSDRDLGITRMRLDGTLFEIDRDDLALTYRECFSLLRRANPGVSTQIADAVFRGTCGWRVGVKMCCDKLAERKTLGTVLGRGGQPGSWALDLLRDEFLPRLQEEELACLLNLSFLPRFDEEMAGWALDGTLSPAVAESLVAQGLLVEDMDDKDDGATYGEAVQYRLHPFLRSSIRALARSRVPADEESAALRRVVSGLERCHRSIDAMETALSCNDYDCAFSVLSKSLTTTLNTSDARRLENILEHVRCTNPEDLRLVYLARAWVAFCQGDAKRASAAIRRFDDTEGETSFMPLRGSQLIRSTILIGVHLFNGEYDEVLSEGRALIPSLGGQYRFLRATAIHKLGEACERMGRYGEALEYFIRARATALVSGRIVIALLCDCEITWIYFIRGKLDAASNVALRALAAKEGERGQASLGESLWATGTLNVALARVRLQWGEIDQAYTLLDRAQAILSPRTNVDAYCECLVTRARCLALEGKTEEAFETILPAYETVSEGRIPRGIDLLSLITFADCLVDRGETARALDVLAETDARLDPHDAFYVVHADLVRARLLALGCGEGGEGAAGAGAGGSSGDEQAEAVLARALGRARASRIDLLVSDCLIRLSCMLWKRGNREESKELMSEALEYCAAEERLYVFRPSMPCLRSVLRAVAYPANDNKLTAAKRTVAAQFADTVLHSFAHGTADGLRDEGFSAADPDGPRGNEKTQPALTRRENEVRRLLEKGETRSEIATELGLSVNTVRTHTRNVYRKLGIHSRADL